MLLLGGVLPLEARAIDNVDLSKKGSLLITFCYGDEPMVGAEFFLYRVAAMDEYCHFTATEQFREGTRHVDLNKMEQAGWEALAGKLAMEARADTIPADRSGVTDETGKIRFGDLELGLYLVFSAPHTQNHATFQHLPVLIAVPNRNQDPDKGDIDTWHYNVTLNGKPVEAKDALKVIKIWEDDDDAAHKRPDKLTIELLRDGSVFDSIQLPVDGKWEYVWENLEYGPVWTVREDTDELDENRYECGDPVRDDKGTQYIIWTITNTYVPPPEPKLPQTGQLWWPVPLLLSAGLLCILVGMLRRRGEKHEA